MRFKPGTRRPLEEGKLYTKDGEMIIEYEEIEIETETETNFGAPQHATSAIIKVYTDVEIKQDDQIKLMNEIEASTVDKTKRIPFDHKRDKNYLRGKPRRITQVWLT